MSPVALRVGVVQPGMVSGLHGDPGGGAAQQLELPYALQVLEPHRPAGHGEHVAHVDRAFAVRVLDGDDGQVRRRKVLSTVVRGEVHTAHGLGRVDVAAQPHRTVVADRAGRADVADDHLQRAARP
jgi:hypothetical protein